MLDVNKIKKDFPILKNNPQLVYLDSTATSLKPDVVLQGIQAYYTQYSANIHRGVYKISEQASQKYDLTREAVAKLINASKTDEIVFTRNTTEAINLVAYALGRQLIQENDEIVTTILEHHSNFVPWQQLALENGGVLKVIDIDDEGMLTNIDKLDQIITKKSKILAITYISNALGVKNPLKQIISAAKQINPSIITVVDAAQAVPHMKVDVQDLGCEFLAFSGHKMLGPTGVGVLYGKYELLDQMYPFQYGGDMISEVTLEKTTFKTPPSKFEAGTPAIGEVIGFKHAIDYLDNLGLEEIAKHEQELGIYAVQRLEEEFGTKIEIYGPKKSEDRHGIVSFNFASYHPHDVAQILDESDVAIRAGHHCAMPLHTYLDLQASCRASFYVYNGKEDVEKLIEGLKEVKKILK